jgi:hypothetical protein
VSGPDTTGATTRDVLLATRNDAKLAELRRIVAALGLDEVHILGLDEVDAFDEAPETGATFADNALAKARDAAAATSPRSAAERRSSAPPRPPTRTGARSSSPSAGRAGWSARRAG